MSTISYAYEPPSLDWEANPLPSYETIGIFPFDERSEPVAQVSTTEETPPWLDGK